MSPHPTNPTRTTRPTIRALFAASACMALLAACGTKGPLTLPGTAPLQTKAAPSPAKPAQDHNSTPTPPASR